MVALDEMAARRSFYRSMGKFQAGAKRSVAILTAFQGKRRLADNRAANADLANDLQRLNLGFYPVVGMGQEEKTQWFGLIRWIVPSNEESFVVQPRGEMSEDVFVAAIRNLLPKYAQFFALMKLPGTPQAFLIEPDGSREYKGSEVRARTVNESYYSQRKGGARAAPEMLSPWEIQGARNPIERVINWWGGHSAMNLPADRSKIGRRFSIKQVGEA